MSLITSLQWMVRKGFWNGVARAKYRMTRPKNVTTVAVRRSPVTLIPFTESFPAIPVAGIRVAKQVPQDERQAVAEIMMRLFANFCRVWSPMQAGRP